MDVVAAVYTTGKLQRTHTQEEMNMKQDIDSITMAVICGNTV